jgi:ESS family glutamate:Na+ symporter
METSFNAEQTLGVAILAFFAGRHLTERISFLDRFRIPEAVTGGLLVAFAVALLRKWGVAISFGLVAGGFVGGPLGRYLIL